MLHENKGQAEARDQSAVRRGAPPQGTPCTQQPPPSHPAPQAGNQPAFPTPPLRLHEIAAQLLTPRLFWETARTPGCRPGRSCRPAATGAGGREPSARRLPGEPAASPAQTLTAPPPAAAFFLFLFFCFSFCFGSAASAGSAILAGAPPPLARNRKRRAPEGGAVAQCTPGAVVPPGLRGAGGMAAGESCWGSERGFTVCIQNNTRFPTGLSFPGSKTK